MADVVKPTKSTGHPLKRIIRKASRSKTSLATQDVTVEPVQELPLERQTSIALTVPDERFEPSEPQSPPPDEEPQSPVSTKEGKRRASLVGKIKRFAGERKEKKPSTVDETAEQIDEVDPDQHLSTSGATPATNGVRPAHVAKRVRDLLMSAPPFYPTTLVAAEVPGSSLPDGASEDLMGAKFLATLSNQTLMAGASGQESVWSILERTKFDFKANMQADSAAKGKASTEPDNSVMLYAPLFPNENSKVELAKYKLVKVPLDDLDGQDVSTAGWWPPSEWGKKSQPTKTVRLWIPSTTQISVQFAWWGFRIWLPEPVVKVLDDKQIEAVKRVAMISTALGWLVSHIPTAGLPVELLAVLSVAKALVPVIGYIGGFIAWYWSTIKGFDKGEGFVLSATWLLPIALIPGHWETPKEPTGPTNPGPAPPTPTTPAPTNPPPTPPTSPPVETPAPPPTSPSTPSTPPNPPIGTSPPPSLPTGGDGTPIITIPAPGGFYKA